MNVLAISSKKSGGIPVWRLRPGALKNLATVVSPEAKAWAKACGFDAKKGEICLLPDVSGKLSGVLFGLGEGGTPFDTGKLAKQLPPGHYRFEDDQEDEALAALGWTLGAYRFDRYKENTAKKAELILKKDVDREALIRQGEASYLARDLINTPANDMGPDALERAARKLARGHSAKISVIKGDDLLKKNFPMIHAVGRASADAPRLIDMKWGSAKAPKITLVGKGVIFDTGGQDVTGTKGIAGNRIFHRRN